MKKETPNYTVIPDMDPGSSPFIRRHNFYKNLDCGPMPTMTTQVKAFTLIELLVVVLIIGILAAIALPQYQKAVEKSRATQALVAVKHILDAQKVYYLANNTYADTLEELGIERPTVDYFEFGAHYSKWAGSIAYAFKYTDKDKTTSEYALEIYVDDPATIFCVGQEAKDKNGICKMLSGGKTKLSPKKTQWYFVNP